MSGAAMVSKFDLTGKVALVTGASRGIGQAIALALAEAGADVAIAARNVDDLAETARRIEALGRNALPVALDVTNTKGINGIISQTAAQMNGIDILVNNAGYE